ncbi:HNH endonuclease, partial [Acidobacteriota bacterium]
MRQCIYCKNPLRFTQSKSHFIPECLGSNKKLENLVCKTCNGDIGKFEQ